MERKHYYLITSIIVSKEKEDQDEMFEVITVVSRSKDKYENIHCSDLIKCKELIVMQFLKTHNKKREDYVMINDNLLGITYLGYMTQDEYVDINKDTVLVGDKD